MRKCTNDKDLEGMMKLVNCVSNSNFVKNLRICVDNKWIELEMYNADPNRLQWDGELIIKFDFKKLGLKDLVNYIIGPSRADEIDILDNGTLRLWWD